MAGDTSDVIVACCGLVCSNCGAYSRGRCEGCHSERPMFASCPVKACVKDKGCSTCADCGDFENLRGCDKLHNLISRIFGWVFGSDRIGNLYRIRTVGLEAFKAERLANKRK